LGKVKKSINGLYIEPESIIRIKQTTSSAAIINVPGRGERPIDHMKGGMLTSVVKIIAIVINAPGEAKRMVSSGLEKRYTPATIRAAIR
jgi:hypothetical protein